MKVLTPAAILERLRPPARPAHRRAARRAGAPADAARRDRLELRPARARRAQTIFERLGVFAGGFTLEAAEAVCGFDALDGIAALVEHSLLTSRSGRFEMLETVREYAHDRLAAGGELDAVRGRPRAVLRREDRRRRAAAWRARTRRLARTAPRRARQPARRDRLRRRRRRCGERADDLRATPGATGCGAATSTEGRELSTPRWPLATGRPRCASAR